MCKVKLSVISPGLMQLRRNGTVGELISGGGGGGYESPFLGKELKRNDFKRHAKSEVQNQSNDCVFCYRQS